MYWFLLKSIWPLNHILETISKMKGLFLISTFWKRKLSLLEMNNAPISSELVKSRIGCPHLPFPLTFPCSATGSQRVGHDWVTSLHSLLMSLLITWKFHFRTTRKTMKNLSLHWSTLTSVSPPEMLVWLLSIFFWTWFPFRSSWNSSSYEWKLSSELAWAEKSCYTPAWTGADIPSWEHLMWAGRSGETHIQGQNSFSKEVALSRFVSWSLSTTSLWWNENKSFCRNHANLLAFNQHELPLHRTGKMYKLQS